MKMSCRNGKQIVMNACDRFGNLFAGDLANI